MISEGQWCRGAEDGALEIVKAARMELSSSQCTKSELRLHETEKETEQIITESTQAHGEVEITKGGLHIGIAAASEGEHVHCADDAGLNELD